MVISREFEFKRFTELEREIQAQSINFITHRVDNYAKIMAGIDFSMSRADDALSEKS